MENVPDGERQPKSKYLLCFAYLLLQVLLPGKSALPLSRREFSVGLVHPFPLENRAAGWLRPLLVHGAPIVERGGEDKANGPAIIDYLGKTIPGMIPFNPKGSKEDRALSVAPYFEAGNVLYSVSGYFPVQRASPSWRGSRRWRCSSATAGRSRISHWSASGS